MANIANKNPIVFLDISINSFYVGRLKIELFSNIAPKTCENFRQFCTGEHRINNKPIGYKSCSFHRLIKGFMVQGGDFFNNDGTGSYSIYGETFEDENFSKDLSEKGLIAMANKGPNSNGNQFFITFGPAEWLNGKHVVFGRLWGDKSMEVLKKIEEVGVDSSEKPKVPIIISECGEL